MTYRSRIVGHGYEDPEQLLANPANWRIHPKPQEDALAGVLSEIGWVDTVLVNRTTGFVVDGHLRVAHAISHHEQLVPVTYLDLTEEEEAVVLASFDPITAMAATDQAQLDKLISGISAEDSRLDALLASLKMPEPKNLNDDTADLTPPENPTTQPGDLWLLGDHRLLCGDSTKADDVARLMDGDTPSVMVADPPYGMRLDADFSDMRSGLRFAQDKGMRGGRRYEQVVGDDQDFDARPVLALCDPREQFWFGADYYGSSLPDTEHSGSWLVWDKRLDEVADRMYGSCFELIWSKHKRRREMLRVKWAGVFGVEQEPDKRRHHPTQKPVDLIAALLDRTEGDVADLFAGAGVTLIASERLGRRCYAMEIDPGYCDVVIRRWETLTGHKATLASATSVV